MKSKIIKEGASLDLIMLDGCLSADFPCFVRTRTQVCLNNDDSGDVLEGPQKGVIQKLQ